MYRKPARVKNKKELQLSDRMQMHAFIATLCCHASIFWSAFSSPNKKNLVKGAMIYRCSTALIASKWSENTFAAVVLPEQA